MWCWYFRRRMEDLLGGVLSPRKEAALHRHLEGCPECADLWNEHCRTRSLIRSWTVPGPSSPVVRRRVMASVLADPFSRECRRFGRVWWRRAVLECAVGAALVLVALHLLIGGADTKVVAHRSPASPSESVSLTEDCFVQMMNDPRAAYLSAGERYFLLGSLATASGEGTARTGGCAGTDGP